MDRPPGIAVNLSFQFYLLKPASGFEGSPIPSEIMTLQEINAAGGI